MLAAGVFLGESANGQLKGGVAIEIGGQKLSDHVLVVRVFVLVAGHARILRNVRAEWRSGTAIRSRFPGWTFDFFIHNRYYGNAAGLKMVSLERLKV